MPFCVLHTKPDRAPWPCHSLTPLYMSIGTGQHLHIKCTPLGMPLFCTTSLCITTGSLFPHSGHADSVFALCVLPRSIDSIISSTVCAVCPSISVVTAHFPLLPDMFLPERVMPCLLSLVRFSILTSPTMFAFFDRPRCRFCRCFSTSVFVCPSVVIIRNMSPARSLVVEPAEHLLLYGQSFDPHECIACRFVAA